MFSISNMKFRVFFWKIARFFLFFFDAERVHSFFISLIRLGIRFNKIPLRVMSGSFFEAQKNTVKHTMNLPVLFHLPFQSRLGLAAGFDKNAEILEALPDLGFGFVEIGTVTPQPQSGNKPPRLFRIQSNEALFNRMGFNSLGAQVVSKNLERARQKLPPFFRVGVNLGKNRDTPLDQAKNDYTEAAQAFEELADYIVINVSSPNTPGLRSLQTVEGLKPIVENMVNLLSRWRTRVPLLLKIAPEIEQDELKHLIHHLEPIGVDGWVLTNTLAGELKTTSGVVNGGFSGKPLQKISRCRLEEARQLTSKPLISVGGIISAEEASLRLAKGADLLQIYTGWIYRGPSYPNELTRLVPELMR